jgi:plasmid stabilization system protein ParE
VAKLIWSLRAVHNIESICEYIEQHSPTAAAKFAVEIVEFIERIPRAPRRGSMVLEFGDNNLLERLFRRRYRIVYRLHPGAVEIVTVCHAARQLRDVLNDKPIESDAPDAD